MYIVITCVAHGVPVETGIRDDLNIGQLRMIERPQFDSDQEITEIRYELDQTSLRCPTACTPEIDQHDFFVKVFDDEGNWLADA